MNKQLSESEALFKIIRIFIVQYLANVHNCKHVQNEAINMLVEHVLRLIKGLIVQMKRILVMQGRIQPNCLHQLIALKKIGIMDLNKLQLFIIEKRYKEKQLRSKSYKFPHIFFEKTISKVFQNDYEHANKYQKDKQLPTMRIIKSPYLFNFNEDSQCLPFRCPIDQAFNKPAQFTYKNTVEKIERQTKNIENLVAFTRRQNRKALGLYLEGFKQEQRPRKKTKVNEQEEASKVKKVQGVDKKSKQFGFIEFL